MTDQVIGVARVVVEADAEPAVQGTNRAKQAVSSLTLTVEDSSRKQVNATSRNVKALERQVQTLGLSREEMIRWRIQTQTSGETAERLTQALDKQIQKTRQLASAQSGNSGASTTTEAETRALEKQNAIRERLTTLLNTQRGQRILEAQGASASASATDKHSEAIRRGGVSLGQYNAALRTLPAQYTDIVTQIAGGQNLGLILLQQGGQIKDSFGGVQNALRGVTQSAAAFINPMALTAAALAATAVAAYQGAQEVTGYNAALISSGNSAGVTSEALADLAAQFDNMEGVTTGKAADALMQVAATGAFTADQMRLVAQAALEWNVATGAAVEDTVKEFTKLAEDPVKAIIELNTKMGFLTDSQVRSIEILVEQGKHTEAVTEAIRLQAEMLSDRSSKMVENLGGLERSWRAVKNTVLEVWDAMKSVGRDDTATEQIRRLQTNIAGLKAGSGVYQGLSEANKTRLIKQFQDQVEALKKASDKALAGNATAGQSAEQRRAIEANAKLRDKNYEEERAVAAKSEKLSERLENLRTKLLRDGVTDRLAIAKAEALETDKFNAEQEKKKKKTSGDGGVNSARMSAVKAEAAREKEALANSTRELQAQYAAREVSANEYYRRLRELAKTGADQEAQAIQSQIAVLDLQKGKRKESGAVAIERASLEAQLAKVQEGYASRLRVITTEETQATEKRVQAMRAYREALHESTVAMQEQFASIARRVGQGDREFEIETKINEVLADKAKRLRDIAQAREAGADSAVSAANEAAVQEEAEAKIEVIRQGYRDLEQEQANALNGITAAVKNYSTESANIAGQVQSAISGVFTGLEDVFVKAAETGKLSFKDMANSILSDLARIAARQAVMGIVGSVLGGLTGGVAASGSAAVSTGTQGITSSLANSLIRNGKADGGYTGNGGKYEPRGVVHAGEVVWSQEDVARAGGVAAVEAMRMGAKGYAGGGSPGVALLSPPKSGPPNVNISIVGGSEGATAEASMNQNGDLDITVLLSRTEKFIAGRIGSGQSPVLSSLKSRLNVEDRK